MMLLSAVQLRRQKQTRKIFVILILNLRRNIFLLTMLLLPVQVLAILELLLSNLFLTTTIMMVWNMMTLLSERSFLFHL